MSALSILYLVLPLPLFFILHDAEEVAVQHRWMKAHSTSLVARFPRMRMMIDRLLCLSTKAFAIAAFEELVVLLLATCYVLVGGACAMQLWSALFMAFSLHLLVHLAQAVMVRGYVPGVVTSVLLLPYAAYGLFCISLAATTVQIILLGLAGWALMLPNLLFAHWLALKLSKPKQ